VFVSLDDKLVAVCCRRARAFRTTCSRRSDECGLYREAHRTYDTIDRRHSRVPWQDRMMHAARTQSGLDLERARRELGHARVLRAPGRARYRWERGAAVAALVTAIPQLVWLSEHQALVFRYGGAVLRRERRDAVARATPPVPRGSGSRA
jgi:hypothetical protein